MFSGIVESTSRVLEAHQGPEVLRLFIQRPAHFDDLKTGDSICTDGVCLTVEQFTESTITFALGLETQAITGWTSQSVKDKVVNLERSLKASDRIHGHFVTGHVDATSIVLKALPKGKVTVEWLELEIKTPQNLTELIWPKGSVALNGVSLTVNKVVLEPIPYFTVGLIPETLKRTNLGSVKEGQVLNLEADNIARGLVHSLKIQQRDNL